MRHLKPRVKYAMEFAAIVSAFPAFVAFNRGSSLSQSVGAAMLWFLIAFSFLLAAQLTSRKRSFGNVELNPWFTCFVIGSFVVFFVGAVAFHNLIFGGGGAVLTWSIIVLGLWTLTGYTRKSKA
jgi:hypothetical protein